MCRNNLVYSTDVQLILCFYLDPPEITKEPADQSVKSSGIAVFYCYATGDPAPNFYWRKNGKKLKNTDSR